MKKRIFSAVLALCMLLTLLPAAVLAVENAGSCGENVKWSLSGGELTISGSGPMYDYFSGRAPWYGQEITSVVIRDGVTSIGDYAFFDCPSLTSITIPDSVTDIGLRAFSGCTSLTSITIPDSVTDIDWYAFTDCTSLTSITIPDSVTSIDQSTFAGCASLTDIALPDSVTYIAAEAFYGCASLTSITIPNSVTSVERCAFDGCTSLIQIDVAPGNASYRSLDGVLMNRDATELICYPGAKRGSYTIPTGVTSIADEAFSGCTNLTGITIPDGVTDIGWRAFYDCASLTGITIPNSLTSIDHEVFCGCASLIQIDVAPGNANFRSLDGVLMNRDATELICCPGRKRGSYTIPTGVTSIAHAAFSGCTNLTGITIPDSVTGIGILAFDGCTSLTSIIIPNSVTSIDICAFYGCTSLTSITIPDSVTSIDSRTFCGCTSLTSITIPDSVTYIGDETFENCVNLTSVTIPASVTRIGLDTFRGCDSVTVYGYWNTQAETYAYAHDIPFVPFGLNFVDLVKRQFYYNPVLWATKNNITSGVSATEFAPNQNCTRGQVVTFLWRAMGCPEPNGNANPFVDVRSDQFYYKAVLWAAENHITSGVDDTRFAPNKTVTRGEFVTFLWRAMGEPAGSGSSPFGDVSKGKFYCDAVLWAADCGITTGVAPGEFRPNDSCTRGQVVTFLYRAFGK